MPNKLIRTKLYVPPVRPSLVPRPRLIERLNQGLQFGHKLTLISAPAGFGKTTLVSEWVAVCDRPAAWLSLDEADNDLMRFLAYSVAALHTIAPESSAGVLPLLQSPQPPPIESILTALINEISTIPNNFVFVLDDYHLIDDQPVDDVLAFLLEHLPPQMHLVISTREDPLLPLSRLRARDQLSELRHRPAFCLLRSCPISQPGDESRSFGGRHCRTRNAHRRLDLSLHTVKVHARNIYGKLGVKNRTQVVAKGRALRILSTS